jgi:transketolase
MKHDARKTFAAQLEQEAKTHPNLMVLTTDSRGSTAMTGFFQNMPERFVEMGIAEQDAVGVAAGLSLTGKAPFVCGPACFLMMRSQEQVKVDVAYSGANVKIIGVSSGVSYGVLGATHHALGDFAAARAMPGLMILAPSDGWQAARMAAFLADYRGPAYLRTGRGDTQDIYGPDDDCFIPGKINAFGQGDIVIAATGEIVRPALDARKLLAEKGVDACVLDVHTLRPLDTQTLVRVCKGAKLVVTAEEHFLAGGLGDAVSLALEQEGLALPRLRLGFPDQYAPCLAPAALKAHYGLDAAGIAARVLERIGG